MKKINLKINDSPLSIIMISIVFISLGYLVSLHPDGFQLFFNFIMITSFVTLTVLLIKWYSPFMKLCDKFMNDKSKTTTVKTYETYHKDIE